MQSRTRDTSSDISHWLDNAGRYPLLPAERVTAIARQIQSLPEDSDKRRRLINTLVSHNLMLVPRFVRGFMRRSRHEWGSPETVDFLQVGALGLVRAAEKYDPARGYTFSTYANHWIRCTVSRYNLKTMTPVTVSESATRQIIFYKRNGYMRQRCNHEPMSDVAARQFMEHAYAAYTCISLDLASDVGTPLVDLVVDEREHWSPDDEISVVQKAVLEAGVSSVGMAVLIALLVNKWTLRKTAETLGMDVRRVQAERDNSMELMQQNQKQIEARIMCASTAP